MRVADALLEGAWMNELKYYDYPSTQSIRSLHPYVWSYVPRPHSVTLLYL